VHHLPREVLQKRDSHHTSIKFQFGVITWVHELFKWPLYLNKCFVVQDMGVLGLLYIFRKCRHDGWVWLVNLIWYFCKLFFIYCTQNCIFKCVIPILFISALHLLYLDVLYSVEYNVFILNELYSHPSEQNPWNAGHKNNFTSTLCYSIFLVLQDLNICNHLLLFTPIEMSIKAIFTCIHNEMHV